MAEKVDKTRECIRQYVVSSGQHKEWYKLYRENLKKETEERKLKLAESDQKYKNKIYDSLVRKLYRVFDKESFAAKKAVENSPELLCIVVYGLL